MESTLKSAINSHMLAPAGSGLVLKGLTCFFWQCAKTVRQAYDGSLLGLLEEAVNDLPCS